MEDFKINDLSEVTSVFKQADEDSSGGLDIEEFTMVMAKFFPSVPKEELEALHMKIDTNCDTTVDIRELLYYLYSRLKATDSFKPKPFSRGFEIINRSKYDHRVISGLLFRPSSSERQVLSGQVRPFRKGFYMSITSDGVLDRWDETFSKFIQMPLFEPKEGRFFHKKKTQVNDMIYLHDIDKLAVATCDREIVFYDVDPFKEAFSLIVEENIVTVMNYWSDGHTAFFSFGDNKGFLTVFMSKNVKEHGLFCKDVFEIHQLKMYDTAYISKLLNHNTEVFQSFKTSIFGDVCKRIQYLKPINTFAICGSSSNRMLLITTQEKTGRPFGRTVFRSSPNKDFFTCVGYLAKLITGGTDGLLRLWDPFSPKACLSELQGHAAPIIDIVVNELELMIFSLSADKNLRIWSSDYVCKQSIQIQGMGTAPLSAVCYNSFNNEFVVANSSIGKCLGRGTDVFQKSLTTHEKPVCSVLYHRIFRQAVSVSQNGVVNVWDVSTGQQVSQFRVTSNGYAGHIAMSFDEPLRRLITVAQDRKVKLWNFNTGEELGVLPFTVQKEVTHIVCINDRVFVSGRNSKKIFDLNIDGFDHRVLKHSLLDDVTSMDPYRGYLAVASSNGNVLLWDVDAADVVYSFNVDQSPKTHSARVEESRPSAPTIVVCLKTYSVNKGVLLIAKGSYIYAWSLEQKALVAKFRAVSAESSAVITSMTTADNEQILVTGDSDGHIHVWDNKQFGLRKQKAKQPLENRNGQNVSRCRPPQLGSWQTHLKGVVSLQPDPACEKVVIAGFDCNVQLWSSTGCLTGIFGRDQWNPTACLDGPQSPLQSAPQSAPQFAPQSAPQSPLPPGLSIDEYLERVFHIRNRTKAQEIPHEAGELLALLDRLYKLGDQWIKNNFQRRAKVRDQQFCQWQQRTLIIKKSKLQDRTSRWPFIEQPPINGRVLKIPETEMLHTSEATPCPPEIPPGHKRAPIRQKMQLPQPKINVQVKHKQESDQTSRFPLIPNEAHQTNLKPHPPMNPPNTGGANRMRTSGRIQASASLMQRSEKTSGVVRLPPIQNEAQPCHQTKLKPRPPESPCPTGSTRRVSRFSRGQ